LNSGSKLFANISYVMDFANNSSIEFLRKDGSMLNELQIKSGRNLALGVGYKYKDRYGLEIRYASNRELLNDYLYWDSNYRTVSVILGYSLF
jgi:hypothetical protein